MYGSKNVSYFNFQKEKIKIEFVRGNIRTDGTKSRNFFVIDDPKKISVEHKWTYKNGVGGGGYSINFNKDTYIDYVMFLIKQKYKNVLN